MEHGSLTPLSSSALLIGRDALLTIWKSRDPRMDPVDALILSTVVHANVDPLTSGLHEQMEFGALDHPPPGELRCRVSINRVADSLDLRFETVRRRIKRLESLGLMETCRTGALVPEHYFHTESNRLAVQGLDAAAAATFRRLDALGFFELHPLPDPVTLPQEHPYRAVARLFMTYALRLGGEMRFLAGDFPNLLLMLQLTQMNTRDRSDDRDPPTTGLGGPLVPDDRKEPASISALSRACRIPFETTRRRLSRMEQAGLCRMVGGGYVAPMEVIAQFALRLAPGNDMNLVRLYRACAQLGAIEGWRRGRTFTETAGHRLAS